jgi:hypothetical protein
VRSASGRSSRSRWRYATTRGSVAAGWRRSRRPRRGRSGLSWTRTSILAPRSSPTAGRATRESRLSKHELRNQRAAKRAGEEPNAHEPVRCGEMVKQRRPRKTPPTPPGTRWEPSSIARERADHPWRMREDPYSSYMETPEVGNRHARHRARSPAGLGHASRAHAPWAAGVLRHHELGCRSGNRHDLRRICSGSALGRGGRLDQGQR